MITFTDKFIRAIREKKSILIAGLDPQLRFMPPPLMDQMVGRHGRTFRAVGETFLAFNKAIIDATSPFVSAAKPQMAFYEIYGKDGIHAFEETVRYAHSRGLLVVEDGKRGDGGDTADAYADGHLGQVPFWPTVSGGELTSIDSPIRVDCLTVHGYIADDCVGRFVERVKRHGTGIFVVTKTSFKPNSRLEQLDTTSGLKVWQELAMMVNHWGEGTEGEGGYRNVGVVMGATYPEDVPWMRKTLPNSWFLVPGFGGQGATADDAVVGANKDGLGIGVNNSRNLTYAYLKGPHQRKPEEYALAAANCAEACRDELNAALRRAGKGQ